jgi:hypothetical protein
MLCMGRVLGIPIFIYSNGLCWLAMDFEYRRGNSAWIIFHF